MSAALSRRRFLACSVAACAASRLPRAFAAEPKRTARIAITLDLEMSRHYPKRGMLEWDYQKGNLDGPTKEYAVKAAKIVKEHGGVLHFFCVGRVLEQPDVGWLKEIAADGHPIGNHTYDHVNLKAKTAEASQFRFQRSPWLVAGKSAAEVIEGNIRITTVALKERAGITVDGFRTPGGFNNGLSDRPDLQQMLLRQGFKWVSSKYPPHERGETGKTPSVAVVKSILDAQEAAQPFVYESGLVEVPMSPISDVTAFRSTRWKLDDFVDVTAQAVARAIETGTVFDFLAHPSCLVVEDPEFKTIKRICRLVRDSRGGAEVVGLGEIASLAAERGGK
jgi:peptidoglycan/xylan/chitin deacetylase (PgdA/CDA1 family)